MTASCSCWIIHFWSKLRGYLVMQKNILLNCVYIFKLISSNAKCRLDLSKTRCPDTRMKSQAIYFSPIRSIQFGRSVVSDSLRPHELQHTRLPCTSPTSRVYSNSWSIELVMPSNHLILSRPLLLLPSIFPSIRVFSDESVLRITWPNKYWSFSFSISASNEYPGLISFRMDWLDLLAVQGTLKHLLQHHGST